LDLLPVSFKMIMFIVYNVDLYTIFEVICMRNRDSTTIRISRSTLRMLERERQKMGVKSLDMVIRELVVRKRKGVLEEVFGIDRGRVKPFTEEDRGEDRG